MCVSTLNVASLRPSLDIAEVVANGIVLVNLAVTHDCESELSGLFVIVVHAHGS